MQNKFLNSKEIKNIREQCIKQFGTFLKKDYVFILSEKDRLFVINSDVAKIDLTKLRIDRFGLYFGEVKENQLRLSKEGAQLLAQESGELQHTVELTKEDVKAYFQGSDLIKDLGSESILVILKYLDNILGCARYKEGRILNFLPKMNRGEVIL